MTNKIAVYFVINWTDVMKKNFMTKIADWMLDK